MVTLTQSQAVECGYEIAHCSRSQQSFNVTSRLVYRLCSNPHLKRLSNESKSSPRVFNKLSDVGTMIPNP